MRTLTRRALSASALLSLVAGTLGLAAPARATTGATRCGDSGTPALVALHDSHFYVDTASTALLLSGYAGYSVRAGASARSHLWLGWGAVSGGVLSRAAHQPAAVAVPDLPSGGSSAQYGLLTATGPTTVPQTQTLTLYDGPPSVGTAVCSRTFTYSDVNDTIKALANKVDGLSSSNPATTGTIGDAVTVTVTGHTGTLGAGPANDPGVLDLTPGALSDFPVDSWRLERTDITISPDGVLPAATYTDRLYLPGASGPDRPYTAHYTFRAIGPTSAPAAVQPIQYIASGTQVKHTDGGSTPLFSLPAVSSTGSVSLTKALTSPTGAVLPSTGGATSWSVTLTNAGTSPTTVDDVVDTLPADATYTAGSLHQDGQLLADPTVSGAVLTVPGPLVVPAGGSTVLTYSAVLGSTSGTRTNTAYADYGSVTYDSTRDVRSTVPASASVTVRGAGGLSLAPDTATTPAGTPVTVAVLSNDPSPSGLPLQVTSVGTPSSGSVVLGSDGRLTFSPASGTSGTATVTYTASDGYASGSTTLTVTVTPVAVRDTYSTGKGVTLNGSTVLANDACTGCTVSSALASGPTLNGTPSGTVTMASNGTFTYVPASSTATGTVLFSYTASSSAGSTVGNVTLALGDLAPDAFTMPYGTATTYNVVANDPACNNCHVNNSFSPLPARGTVAASGNSSVTYTPTSGLWGLDSFGYGLTGSSGSSTTPVTVLVGPPAVTLATTYGTAATRALPTGGSCSGCTYSTGTAPTSGTVTVDSSTGSSTYTPGAGFAGTDSYTYVVKDPVSGLRLSGTVTVTVGPKATNDTATTRLGSPVSGNVTSNDSCPATCTATLDTPPSTGTLVLGSSGAWTYAPGTSMGTAVATYHVTSTVSGSASSTATLTVTVGGAADDTASTPANAAVDIPVLSNDPCTSCTLLAVGTPTAGSATAVGSVVRYVPSTGFSGRASLTYTATAGGVSTSATVLVTVLPHAVDDSATTTGTSPVQLRPLVNDLCAGCVLTGLGTPSSGSASHTGDLVTFVPTGAGVATFTYTAVDTYGDPVTGTITVSSLPLPGLTDDTASAPSGSVVTTDVLANDTCTGCTAEVTTDPLHGSATVDVLGRVTYASTPGWNGDDVLTYTATAPSGATATATLTVRVTPVAVDDTGTAHVGAAVLVPVLANDLCDACGLAVGTPDVGSASVSGNAVVVTSPTAGTVHVTYTVTGPGGSAAAQVTVVVSDASPDSATTPHATPVTVDVLSNDTCTTCTVTVGSAPGGTASTDGTTVTFAPDSSFSGLAVLPYTASNGASSTVRVLVAPAVVHRDLAAGTTVSGALLPTCQGCVARLLTPTVQGELTLLPDGTWTWVAPGSWTGQESWAYRVTDPVSGQEVDGSVTLTVSAPAPAVSLGTAVSDPGSAPVAGQVLTWTWTTTNTGSLPLTGVALTPASAGCPAFDLAVSAVHTCTGTHALTQAEVDAGTLTGTATVTGASTGGPVSASDSLPVALPRVPDLAVSASAALTGTAVDLTYTVTDTGTTTLSGVVVDLGSGPSLACTPTTLAPGQSATCTGTHVLTPSDVGTYTTSGTASATSPGGSSPVTGTAGTSTTLPSASSSPSPTEATTVDPTVAPTVDPTVAPTIAPTVDPTVAPTVDPTVTPTIAPTVDPTVAPTVDPTVAPTVAPTVDPTTTPSPVVQLGSVAGQVWFDRDQDGVRGPREWPLPGITVTLTQQTAALRTGRAAHLVQLPLTQVTDADGHYAFTDVPVGRWTVRAALTAAGLERTSDTDGLTDWSVALVVAPGSTAPASFAGLGKGTLDGTVFTSTTGAPVADASVVCRWAGFDDVLGTADDVTMPVSAGADGAFDLTQVPYGSFSCSGTDPVTGLQSASAAALVMSPVPVTAALPIVPATAPVTVPPVVPPPAGPAAPAVPPADGSATPSVAKGLPHTGADTSGALRWALGLLLGGLMSVLGGRRRRSGQDQVQA